MRAQGYISTRIYPIFTVTQKKSVTNRVAILFSGLLEPCCDVDYFMSRLSNSLFEKGITAIQVDPFGHGDSYGSSQEISMDLLKESLFAAIEYVNSEYGLQPKIITRGLMGNIALNAASTADILCINPLIVTSEEYIKIKSIINDLYQAQSVYWGTFMNHSYIEEMKFLYRIGIGRNQYGIPVKTTFLDTMIDESCIVGTTPFSPSILLPNLDNTILSYGNSLITDYYYQFYTLPLLQYLLCQQIANAVAEGN